MQEPLGKKNQEPGSEPKVSNADVANVLTLAGDLAISPELFAARRAALQEDLNAGRISRAQLDAIAEQVAALPPYQD